MKVLIYTNFFVPSLSGVSIYAYKLATYFSKSYNKVIVLCPKFRNYNPEYDKNLPFTVKRYFRSRGVKFNVLTGILTFLYAYIRFKPNKIVVVEGQSQLVCGILRLFFKFSYYLMVHGNQELLLNKNIKSIIMKTFFKKANRIIAVCNYYKDKLILAGINHYKIEVIPCAVDSVFISSPSNQYKKKEYLLHSNEKVLLTVSRLYPEKGLDNVIRTLPDLIRVFPNIKYLIVGEGEYKYELIKLVKQLNLLDYVLFKDTVSNDNLIPIYDMADIFILPSRGTEGMPLCLLEAGARSKAIIAGKVGGIPEFIIDGVSGLLVDSDNPDQIKEAIKKLLFDSNLRDKLGKNIKEKIQSEYIWEKISKDFLRVLTN